MSNATLPPPEELIRLHEVERLTYQAIGDHYGTTRQAVYDRINKYLAKSRNPYVPWTARPGHRKSDPQLAAEAHGKWRLGEAVTPDEMHLANTLRTTAAQLGGVMVYHPDLYYCWRDRRPSDVDIIAAA